MFGCAGDDGGCDVSGIMASAAAAAASLAAASSAAFLSLAETEAWNTDPRFAVDSTGELTPGAPPPEEEEEDTDALMLETETRRRDKEQFEQSKGLRAADRQTIRV